jgi:hypothetical protein
MRLTDADLVKAFLNQEDRPTHSGRMLGDCFSKGQFELAFEYGSVVQRSAIRHALIACLTLPPHESSARASVRHATFEKHLENLLVHALRSIAADQHVARPERVAADLLVEATRLRSSFQVAGRLRMRDPNLRYGQHALTEASAFHPKNH